MERLSLNGDLDEILVFTRVVQGGSFTAAAKALGMPKSTVSRKLSELEQRVGARLLQRTTRKVGLTDIGRVYYEHCVRIVAEVEEAQLAVAGLQSTPRGLIRVTVPLATFDPGPDSRRVPAALSGRADGPALHGSPRGHRRRALRPRACVRARRRIRA